MTHKVHESQITLASRNVCPSRAVPLSTRQIFAFSTILAIYSFVYLIYAQHHALLFYVMTGVIVTYILFVYISGIAAVLYMVVYDYDIDEKIPGEKYDIEESAM
ncbi:unnamed protein product [Caenorhabditis bovis]|uniref:Uncharacterized protein n=1 Tax=Caenorhabditis bovis TaxID=2654633 RepID=A0A8S1EQM3_9PELO|nr:unnamed protein product [Caenorhabditis bovis]